MKRITLLLPVLLAVLCTTAALTPVRVEAAARKDASAASSHKKGNVLHQFSGTVTSVDKSSLTVAKAGKDPKTMVFARLADTRTQGELEKDAHVTVWYRDEDGHAVAHRVVVKGSTQTAAR